MPEKISAKIHFAPRLYHRQSCVVFHKTKELYGELSNMAGGYPLRVNGTRILTSEALYQACYFPHLPEVQRLIIAEKSPMSAKMRRKKHRRDARPDWDAVRVAIMEWCLRVKLAQHWERFGTLLLSTGDRLIVEQSRRDDFWGAKVVDDETLFGANVLGQLLMTLRKQVQEPEANKLQVVQPPAVPGFLLEGKEVGLIEESRQ
jgi:type I restriction enzyme S subunit